jgi:hypothetical protein
MSDSLALPPEFRVDRLLTAHARRPSSETRRLAYTRASPQVDCVHGDDLKTGVIALGIETGEEGTSSLEDLSEPVSRDSRRKSGVPVHIGAGTGGLVQQRPDVVERSQPASETHWIGYNCADEFD